MFTRIKQLVLLFGKKNSKNLKQVSGNIYSVFTNTVKDLEEVNSSVVEAMNKQQEIVNKAQIEGSELLIIKNNNQKLIDKINEFLK